jgi:hypothetical protein
MSKWQLFRIGLFAALCSLAIVAFGMSLGRPVEARDNGQWGEMPSNIREWFKNLQRPDFPGSCCGEADAYEADRFEIEGDHYVAIITDGSGGPDVDDGEGGMVPGKPTRQNGTRIKVPNEKMKWDAGNPTGHGVLFLSSGGDVFCYVTPGGV